MCSFAKFLALGLIASEGHGPVFGGATGSGAPVATPSGGIAKDVYRNIVGKDPSLDDEVKIMQEACRMMNAAHKQEKDTNVAGWSEGMLCSRTEYDKIKEAMIVLWQQQAGAPTPGKTWKLDTPASGDNNIKMALITKYKADVTRLGGALPGNTAEYYKQIEHLRAAVQSAKDDIGSIWDQARDTARRARNMAAKALPTSNPGWREVAENTVTGAGEPFTDSKKPGTLPDARQKLVDAEALERGANAAFTYVDNARKEEISRETVGGFFGVFFGLVGLTLAFLMSPCVQFDFNTGKTATNWATGEVDDEWTQMEMYKEAYKTDKTPEQWRNEVFGLPEQPVDSAKATSSALTLVPVVVLAGGVFAVARRGLNKRRAQKKAKRVSRAQQKLHEDL